MAIEIYSSPLYLRITGYTENQFLNIKRFCRIELAKLKRETLPGTYKSVWKVSHVFAKTSDDKKEVRIPPGCLELFLNFMERCGVHKENFIVYKEEFHAPAPVDIKIREQFKDPLPHQIDWIDYQLDGGPVKVNQAATGNGKTYMALYTASKLGLRTIITVQPRYVTTWQADISKTLDIDEKDVLAWDNSDLEVLASKFESGEYNHPIIILRISSVMSYYRRRVTNPELRPLDLILEAMGIGFRIVDEAHESFHEVTMSLLYGRVPFNLILSATLDSDCRTTDKMYRLMFPVDIRLKDSDPENYIDIYNVMYSADPRKYKLNHLLAGNYNELVYELSILNNPLAKAFYFKLMTKLFVEHYYELRMARSKCIIFFGRVDMCLEFKEHLLKVYPMLDIDTFLGTLDKKTPTKYLRPEVLITTPGSCGTGKDIPGLITNLCSFNVKSDQKNKQIIGRLRKPKNMFDKEVIPRMVCVYNFELKHHHDIKDKRKVSFSKKENKTFYRDSFMRLGVDN